MRYLVNVVASIFWLMDVINLPFMDIFDTVYPLNGLFYVYAFLLMCALYEIEREMVHREEKTV